MRRHTGLIRTLNLVHPEWNLSRNESQTDGTVYQSQKQLDVYMHTAVGPSLSEKSRGTDTTRTYLDMHFKEISRGEEKDSNHQEIN
ncbi:hypothetical protein OUZ56_001557 [Daphnia magna]|uniref:Uncharacterized protein n=1 Tax=Daphnia magna TaxID=35525 RepID=A0ABR0A314_9CRUS|nr:hypothetical protein OUZ56_001557 [Daphnia magna]